MRIHFIAVGGTGMGALACLLKRAGHDVRGSDQALYPPMSTQIEQAGVPVFEGFAPENLDWGPECVVVGNVCSRDHIEVVAAKEREIPLESFPSMLEKTLLEERRSLVVAGTHGKTTTSSALSWLLRACGEDPSWLVGGVPLNLGRGSHLGDGPSIVIEGDEYDTAFFDKKSKFLHYRPHRAILTSVEFDHADIFDDFAAVSAAFREFVELIPAEGDLVVNAQDTGALAVAQHAKCNVHTYAVLGDGDGASSADYVVCERPDGSLRTCFEVFERGESLGLFSTGLVGRFNLGNLLAAFAIARLEGCSVDKLRSAVLRFRGVKRRQELLGIAQGVRVIEDFAHHPTAVQLAVSAIRRRYPEHALRVCFEPRSASSRRAVFFDGYTEAFDAASSVYVGPLYAPHKVPEADRLDTQALARAISQRGTPARAFPENEALAQAVLADAVPGDTVLLLSCGSFDRLQEKVLYGLGDPLTFAVPDDRPQIDALLARYGMPPVQVPEEVESLVLRGDQREVIGCVNLQMVGDEAYLFGLAVEPDRRGEGLGWILADTVLRRARNLGAPRVYLLTNEAADFFANRLGFSTVEVDQLSLELRESANFAAGRQDGSICMQLDLATGK